MSNSPVRKFLALLALVFANSDLQAQSLPLEISRETTYLTSPLNSRGTPDYLRAVNEQFAVGATAENNFWVLMWPALGNAEHSTREYLEQVEQQLGVTIPEQGAYVPLHYTDEKVSQQLTTSHEDPWKREQFPVIAKWVEDNQQFLQIVEQASRRSHTYAPIVAGGDSDLLIYMMLPHVQRSRDAARLLKSRAMLHLGNGDANAAWQDILTSYRLAGHIDRGPTLIERLVAHAIRAMSQQSTITWLSHCQLNAEQLAAHRQELQPLLAARPMSESIDGIERLMTLQLTIAIADGSCPLSELDDLLGPPNLLSNGSAGTSAQPDPFDQLAAQLQGARLPLLRYLVSGADLNVTLQEINRNVDAWVQALQPADHQKRLAALAEIGAKTQVNSDVAADGLRLVEEFVFASDEAYSKLPARAICGLLAPAFDGVNRAYTRGDARSANVIAAFLVAEELQRSGKLPRTLTDVPGDMPLDPYTGNALGYRVSAGTVTIYAFGDNLRDDGGQIFNEGEGTDDIRATLLVP